MRSFSGINALSTFGDAGGERLENLVHAQFRQRLPGFDNPADMRPPGGTVVVDQQAVDQLLDGQFFAAEFADGHDGAHACQGRDAGMNAGAVGQSRVQARIFLVKKAADAARHVHHGGLQRLLAGEFCRDGGELALAFDENLAGAVDQDFRNVIVLHYERFDRYRSCALCGLRPYGLFWRFNDGLFGFDGRRIRHAGGRFIRRFDRMKGDRVRDFGPIIVQLAFIGISRADVFHGRDWLGFGFVIG